MGVSVIFNKTLAVAGLLAAAESGFAGCRGCAQTPLGGPQDNPYTAYDSLCQGSLCSNPGYPQIAVNLSNLALYVKVTDLPFGGPGPSGNPGFSLDRAFNMDNGSSGPFGTGWTFSLGDRITANADGTVTLVRGSGRADVFAGASNGYFPVTATADTLTQNSDGSYALAAAGTPTVRLFRADGRLAAIQDGGVNRVTLDYDGAGRLTVAHYRGRTVNFSYDGAGHITGVSDSAGRTVAYAYSGDQLTGTTNADGQTVAYQYDGAGNLAGISYGSASFTIAFTADPPYNSVASVTTSDGAVRQYDTPQMPEQIRVRDGNGDASFYVSNAAGLLEAVTDGNGNTVSYGYDAAGRRTKVVNGAGESVTFTYNSAGNLVSVTDNAGNQWRADYTASGPAHITDPNGNVWTLKYDGSGNLIAVTNPAGGTSTATRAAGGAIAAISDPAGDQTGYQYDANGLLAMFTDALGGQWTYGYDGAARAFRRTDPAGATLQAGYGAGMAIASLAAGQSAITVDLSGQQRDGLNRLTAYTDSFGNQISYTYDAGGNLTAMTLPGGKKVTYQYDHAHRLIGVRDWLGNFAVYKYDAAGYPVSLNASGLLAIYQYDAARRLTAIASMGADGTLIAGYSYTYDAAGNRTGVKAVEPLAAAPAITDYTASFDAAGLPLGRSDNQFFQYDARGYLTAVTGGVNLTAGYDDFGRLNNFSSAHATAYTYDSTGLRVVRTVDGTDRRFLYDLSGARPRLVMETAADNSPVAWYVYGLGLLWKITPDATTYYFHFDGDGNVVAVSNPAQGVVNAYRYDPAGLLAGASETIENGFRARGERGWMDDGNGLEFTGTAYRYPAAGLTLPATANPAPPVPGLAPALGGGGACILQGSVLCSLASGRSR